MSTPTFRFAPSPNGRLHLGHAYSALLNWRMARQTGGKFLIRIEDLDVLRCTPALAQAALDDLQWLGLVSDEPALFQSRHLPDYRLAQNRLRDKGLLYPCFCSRQDIAQAAKDGKRDPEGQPDRKSTRLNSSHTVISYAVFCLKKKKKITRKKLTQTHHT